MHGRFETTWYAAVDAPNKPARLQPKNKISDDTGWRFGQLR
jgi:hypothetical protein